MFKCLNLKNLNKWMDIPCYWIGRINIVKIAVFPKIIYRFNAVCIKIPPFFFFTESEQYILQLVWKHKCLQIAKVFVRKKSRARINRLPIFRLYYKATVIKMYGNTTKIKVQINDTGYKVQR